MSYLLQIFWISSLILLSIQIDFHIYQWEWLIIDEDYVDIDYAVAIDGNRFNVKAQSLKPMDYSSVRVFFFKN